MVFLDINIIQFDSIILNDHTPYSSKSGIAYLQDISIVVLGSLGSLFNA